MLNYKVLLADDDNSLRTILSESLVRAGYEVVSLENGNQLMDEVCSGNGDIVLTDVIMPDGDGIDLIPKIKKLRQELPIIVMSARSNLLTAIRSNEEGAFDYLPKPFDINDMLNSIERALSSKLKNITSLSLGDLDDSFSLIGDSPSMQSVFKTMSKVLSNDLSILIIGESGTGKELIAKKIHEFSNRKNEKFIALNMAAIPKDLIESELFGHEKGSFTGATNKHLGKFTLSNNGTLFLDEIGDMPFSAQTRLLRVLQEKEYTPIGGEKSVKTNARIIAASQKSLDILVNNGKFRKDLYYRLNVIPINVPPLKDRLSDIPLLVNHFLTKIADEGLPKKVFSDEALKYMLNYSWPGNIRELENFIKRVSILSSDKEISLILVKDNLQNLFFPHRDNIINNSNLSTSVKVKLKNYFNEYKPDLPPSGLYDRIIKEIERPLIELCLKATGGNQFKAASLLGINRNTLRKKIKELKISTLR